MFRNKHLLVLSILTTSLFALPACSDDTGSSDTSASESEAGSEAEAEAEAEAESEAEAEAEATTGDGDGDGDGGDGDGDGDGGDGDGDSGDGDGDGDSGDGDGDSGDGDGDGDGDSGDGDGDGDGGLDTTPPTVVSATPDHLDDGIYSDATIVIEFSEEMDKASTQAAFQSADVVGVTYGWNAAGTILTITPNSEMAYATGDDPTVLDALEFDYSITTTAEDLAGNALAADYDVTFSTLKDITLDLNQDTALSGYVRADGPGSTLCLAGDSGSASNAWYRCGQTFDLDLIPANVEEIVEATFSAVQGALTGDHVSVFTDLGPNVNIMDIQYATRDVAGFNSVATQIAVYSNSSVAGDRDQDVLTQVQADWNASGTTGNTQFLIRFDLDSDFDGIFERAAYTGMSLEVNYLVP